MLTSMNRSTTSLKTSAETRITSCSAADSPAAARRTSTHARQTDAAAGTPTVTAKVGSKFRLLTMAMGDLASPGLEISGDQAALQAFLGVLDQADPNFNIVTP